MISRASLDDSQEMSSVPESWGRIIRYWSVFSVNQCSEAESLDTLCTHHSLKGSAAVAWFVCIFLRDVYPWPHCTDGQGYSQDTVALSTPFFPLQGVCPARRVSAPSSGSIKCPLLPHLYRGNN